jgi:hypothetical protein
VYAGIDDSQGTLWSCDPANPGFCHVQDSAGKGKTYYSMLYAIGRVWVGIDYVFWDCDANTINACTNLAVPSNFSGDYVTGIQLAENSLIPANASVFASNVVDCAIGEWTTYIVGLTPPPDVRSYTFQTLEAPGSSCHANSTHGGDKS